MDLNNLFDVFKKRCKTIKPFISTKTGRNLAVAFLCVFVLMFVAPLFQGTVGAMLFSCVAAPMIVLLWRRYDMRHAIVPAVFLCIPMILDMLIYHTLSIAVCLLIAIVCTVAVAIHPAFSFIHRLKDNMYAYLFAGAVCVLIVILSSILIVLVSIAWWIFCLLLFLAVVAIFFTVVLSSAAYTATDAKRQARKKQHKEQNLDYDSYDLDTFAQDIGLKYEEDYESPQRNHTVTVKKERKNEPLFYDAD